MGELPSCDQEETGQRKRGEGDRVAASLALKMKKQEKPSVSGQQESVGLVPTSETFALHL